MSTTDVASFHVPQEVIDTHLDWTECVAFKFEKVNDGTVRLRVAYDLELITRPEAADAS